MWIRSWVRCSNDIESTTISCSMMMLLGCAWINYCQFSWIQSSWCWVNKVCWASMTLLCIELTHNLILQSRDVFSGEFNVRQWQTTTSLSSISSEMIIVLWLTSSVPVKLCYVMWLLSLSLCGSYSFTAHNIGSESLKEDHCYTFLQIWTDLI